MGKASFSLLRRGSVPPEQEQLFRTSVLLFFEVTTNGIRFPIHAFVINLVLSIVISLVLLFFLVEITIISPEDKNTFPGKLYCFQFLGASLSIEFTAQLIHVVGSILLIFGAVKRSKIFCYAYVVCSILSFITSTVIRTYQVFLSEMKQCSHPKMLPLKYRPDLPDYFKLTLMWLVCQLFWYWLVSSFVVAQLEWFKTLQTEQDIASITPESRGQYGGKVSEIKSTFKDQ